MSGRGEANPVFRLATRAGKMDQSCPAGYIWNFPFGWTWEWTVNQKWSYLTLIWSTERVWEFCCQLCILLLLWCKSQKVWSLILSKQISRWLYFYLFYFQGFKRIQTEIIFDRFGPRLPVTMVFFGGKTEMPIKLIFLSDSVFFPSLPYLSDILCQMLALLQYIFMCKIHNFHPCIHVGARSRSCLIASNLGWPGSSKSGSQDWFREQ